MSAYAAVLFWLNPINSALGLRFEDEAMERRFTDERVGYARTEAETFACVLLCVWGVIEMWLTFRQKCALSMVVNIAIIGTYPPLLRRSGASEARPYGLHAGGITVAMYVRLVTFLWIPLTHTLCGTEQMFESELFATVYIIAIPIMQLVIPGVSFADHLAQRLMFVGFFAPAHYTHCSFWGPLVGMLMLLYLYLRAEREVFRQESNANARLLTALHFLSHETRNLVGPCMSMIAAQKFEPPGDQHAIMVALGSVNGILSNVLLMAQLDDNKATPVCFPTRPFQLRDWVEVTAAIGRQNVREGVRFVLAIDSEVSEKQQWVLGALPALNQVVSNVLSNACKFTAHGSVTLRWSFTERLAPVAHAQTVPEDSAANDDDIIEGTTTTGATVVDVVVVCEDTGCGIPDKMMPEIFETFGRVRRGIGQHDGTGLGLPLSKRLLESMGGRFDMKSHVGQGTSICIAVSLPRITLEAIDVNGECDLIARLLSRILSTPSNVTKDVLAVDDSKLCRMVYERACRQRGLSVALSADGTEAVQRVQEGQFFGLIILDNEMPMMSGGNTSAACRAAGYTGAIIMVTGNEYSDTARRRLCSRFGLDHIFTKGDLPGVNGLIEAWHRHSFGANDNKYR